MRKARSALCAMLCGLTTAHSAETTHETPSPRDDGAIPQALQSQAFEPLLASSPFSRSLGVSDSLILTGVAQFGNDVFATLLDIKTQESQVVSLTPNGDGWKLIRVDGDPDKLHTWIARVQIQGGEIISIRYQKPPPKPASRTSSGSGGSGSGSNSGGNGNLPPITAAQADEARKAAVNYREGFSSDGYPRQPPPEVVQKLSRLSVSQREDLNRQMMGHRNRGLGLNDRRRIYEDLLNRASQSRR